MAKQDPGSNVTITSTDITATGTTADSPVVDFNTTRSCTFYMRALAVGTSYDGALWTSPDNSTWTLDDGVSGNDQTMTQLVAVGVGQIDVPNPTERYAKVIYTAVGVCTGASVAVTGPLRHVTV
jgi:hypothetical protein